MLRKICVIMVILAVVPVAWAGPPFVTDDPEPVEYQHWEVYLASQLARDADGWSGTSPHVEVNYGVVTNLQLHLIAPIAFSAPEHGPKEFGYGDTELGTKYRFVQETTWCPQIGVFPLLEVPTGGRERGLGTGHVHAFLPVWMQKSWGVENRQWTSYGGGGYWINPGEGNRDWWFVGWLLQRQITDKLTLGTEVFHETVQQQDGRSDTWINPGLIFDFSDTYHLLLSAGHTVQGPGQFQSYVAFQLTFGPGK
jgi:hypothetical protein